MAVAKPPGAKRVANFLDPMHPMAAPTVTSDGKALALTGLESVDFRVDAVDYTVLLATNTGNSGTVATVFQVGYDGSFRSGSMKTLTIPTLAAAGNEPGGATSSRAMKLSVTVVNCSNALKRGGRVTYLNSSQRLPTMRDDATTEFIDLIEGIKACPYRRRINGTDLATPKQLIAFPVDGARYRTFEPHQGTLQHIPFFKHIMAAGPVITDPQSRPMSSIAFIFDPVAEPQDYSVTVRASFYTRWPLTTVPGQKMQSMPTADPKLVNQVHDHAENAANELMHVAEGGLIATVAPKVAGAARGMLSRAASTLVGAGAEAVPAAEALLPLLI